MESKIGECQRGRSDSVEKGGEEREGETRREDGFR